MDKRIAIVGAGWAGCAAAVEGVSAGCHVTLFEASHISGGRARKTFVEGMAVDNGQHILLGAYRQTLRLMRQVGIDTRQAFLNLPLQMRYPPFPAVMDFVTPRWPAPFHLIAGLLKAKGLNREDRLALARFFACCRAIRWDIGEDRPVIRLLEQFRQTPKLYALLWRPLCLAALNTSPEQASASVFLAVLRDSLGRKRTDSDMLVPVTDLSALFPEKALAYCIARKGVVRLGETVRHIAFDGKGWVIDRAEGTRFDAVILATSAAVARSLISDIGDASPLAALEFEPITTCYLKYPSSVRLERPFYALLDYPEKKQWGQFVFDRGYFIRNQEGLLAVIISVSSVVDSDDKTGLAAGLARQLAESFGNPELEKPLWSRVMTEKRATFRCTPGLVRPGCLFDKRGLLLAGDYVAGEYPATLESAVSSGVSAIKVLSELQR